METNTPLSKADYIKRFIKIPDTLKEDLWAQGVDADTEISNAIELEYQYYLASFSRFS